MLFGKLTFDLLLCARCLFETQQFEAALLRLADQIQLCTSSLCQSARGQLRLNYTTQLHLLMCYYSHFWEKKGSEGFARPKQRYRLQWGALIKRARLLCRGQRSFCLLTNWCLDILVSLLDFGAKGWWGSSVIAKHSVESSTSALWQSTGFFCTNYCLTRFLDNLKSHTATN